MINYDKIKGNKKPECVKDDGPIRESIVKLAKMITDRPAQHLGLKKITKDDPEYWGLAALISDEEAELASKLGVREPKTFEEIHKLSGMSEEQCRELIDHMSEQGILEYNWENLDGTNPKNEKWVNGKGEEYIFNIETGRIVKDGINNGTFNIAENDKNSFNPIDTIVHFGLDVASWENYGIGKNDVLTKEQRKIFSEMGSKYIKNPIFKSYIDNLKGGKLTESIYREYLKFEGGTYHEQFQ